MKSYRFALPVSLMILLLALAAGCAEVSGKGMVPQYTGLGQFEGSQGLNFGVSRKEAPIPNPNVPVIRHAFAVDRGAYGTALRVYLEAADPNGDMLKIATTVDQVGYGHYPTDFIILKPQFRKEFKGYIQWNTFSSHTSIMSEWMYVYVTVAVIDKAGNISNEFVFPFSFETGTVPAPTPPAPFDQGNLPKLGNVSIDLFDPLRMGAGNSDQRD